MGSVDESDQKAISINVIPGGHNWVADAVCNYITIDNFDASWTVPSHPINNDNVDFIFNGIESNNGNVLFQPVLQWNQAGYSQKWSIESWALWPNGGVVTGPVTVVQQGDTIQGQLFNNLDLWNTYIRANNGQWTGVQVSDTILGTQNIQVCETEEVYWSGQNPVPEDYTGSVLFYGNIFQYNNWNIDIYWQNEVRYSGITVDSDQSTAGSWVSISKT